MTAEIDQPAPDFTAAAHNRDNVTLSEFKGKQNVLLSFHVFSFTGGWTDQVSSFRANEAQFDESNTQILAISADSRATQIAYAASLGSIAYPILSDFSPHGQIAKAYGVYNESNGAPKRSVFIIDKNGIIRHKELYARATDINIQALLERIGEI